MSVFRAKIFNKWLLAQGLIAAGLLVGLLGCSPDRAEQKAVGDKVSSDGPAGAPARGGRLVIGVQQEPERLSEILNATATNSLVCNLIFSKFVKYDDAFNLVPDLIEVIPTVENGGISADHLTYTYRLRKDAFWQDGTPVTSGDVKFTYEVIMDPKVNVESREGWDVIADVETPEAHVVVFRLKAPYPDFVSETFYEESVLPAHLLENERGEKFHLSGFHHAPVGSGPFVFEEWVSGSHLSVRRNERYYGEGPYLDEIIFKFVPNENTLLVQLKTGEIDLYDNANTGFLEQLSALAGVELYSTPTLMYEHLDLNLENPILQDKRVRQALMFATDKDEIVSNVYHGWALKAALDEYPSSRYFNGDAAARSRYDAVQARRLLRDAGWIDADGDGIREKDGKKLTLSISATSGNPDRERSELVLREQYRRVGIDLEIRNYHSSVLYGSFDDGGVLKRGKFDIAMYAWLSSPEPATKKALYAADNIPPKGQNHPRIRHAELSRLLALGAAEIDPEKRIRIYHEISEILVDEVPVIPLFWYTAVDICTDRLQNYRPNPTQSADTWNANTWYMTDSPPQ